MTEPEKRHVAPVSPDPPKPAIPLEYRVESPPDWKPVRIAFGIYLLGLAIASLSVGIFEFSPSGWAYSYPSMQQHYGFLMMMLLCYLGAGCLRAMASIGYFTRKHGRGALAISAEVIVLIRDGFETLHRIFDFTLPPAHRVEIIYTDCIALLPPLVTILFIISFARFDNAHNR